MSFATGTMLCILTGHAGVAHPIGNGRFVEICRHCHKTLRTPDQMQSVDATPRARGFQAAAEEHFRNGGR